MSDECGKGKTRIPWCQLNQQIFVRCLLCTRKLNHRITVIRTEMLQISLEAPAGKCGCVSKSGGGLEKQK